MLKKATLKWIFIVGSPVPAELCRKVFNFEQTGF